MENGIWVANCGEEISLIIGGGAALISQDAALSVAEEIIDRLSRDRQQQLSVSIMERLNGHLRPVVGHC